jgi:hypothetical protein
MRCGFYEVASHDRGLVSAEIGELGGLVVLALLAFRFFAQTFD